MAKTATVKVAKDYTAEQTAAMANLKTKSAQIRFLIAEGWSRSEIATKLGILYQHVRNVELQPLKRVA